MHNLLIDLGSCVKISAKASTCTKCEDICPVTAISYDENIPKINDACIDCGGCIGVCPSEAISLKDFNTLDFLFTHIESDENLISCKKNIPCLATLSVENMISLALLTEETILDLGHCASCDIAVPLAAEIEKNIKETNDFLEKIESEKRIISQELAYEEPVIEEESNRRDFLKKFSLDGALKSKIEFEKAVEEKESGVNLKDSANIRDKSLPNKRKLLFMALKRADKPESYHTFMHDDISFTSQKNLNDSCDNCSLCYRVCPTGALQSDRRQTKIEFDSLLCIKCALCHDVCEVDAITLAPYTTQTIFEPKVQELKNFKVVRCDECANYFSYFGGEKMCPRCKIEEEEAKSLWGIQ